MNRKDYIESYDCSNIIDLQSIENDLNYLNTYELLEKHNTNDMIKLHNKLNKEYGKHNKSLESYLDTRIKSMEEDHGPIKEYFIFLGNIFKTLAAFLIKLGSLIKQVFVKIISNIKRYSTYFKDVKHFKMMYERNKELIVDTNIILKEYNPRKTELSISDILTYSKNTVKLEKEMFSNFVNIMKSLIQKKEDDDDGRLKKLSATYIMGTDKIIKAYSDRTNSIINSLFKNNNIKPGNNYFEELYDNIKSLNDDEFCSSVFGIQISDKQELKVSEIFINVDQIIMMNKKYIDININYMKNSEFMIFIGKSMEKTNNELKELMEQMGPSAVGFFQNLKGFSIANKTYALIVSKMNSGLQRIGKLILEVNRVILKNNEGNHLVPVN